VVHIRIALTSDEDPDPHQSEKSDPDPHRHQRQKLNPDPQHRDQQYLREPFLFFLISFDLTAVCLRIYSTEKRLAQLFNLIKKEKNSKLLSPTYIICKICTWGTLVKIF
jgi:hypothetical protein